MRLTKKTLVTVVVGGAVAFGAVGGVAVASASSNPTIKACASKHTGALRLASHCSSKEKAVAWNAYGPRGATGPRGHVGATGSFNAGDTYLVRNTITVAASSQNSAYAFCPSGEVAIGGGAGWYGGASSGDYIADSGPVSNTNLFSTTTTGSTPVSWYASMHNLTGSTQTAYVWAICA